MQTAQRYGGDEILVGRGEDAAPDAVLQWTLYTRTASESWSGPLAAGIDHTVDFWCRRRRLAGAAGATRACASTACATSPTTPRVDAAAGGAPGVRRANIVVADPGSVVFEVTVRGGAAGLEQALAGRRTLVPRGAGRAARVSVTSPRGGASGERLRHLPNLICLLRIALIWPILAPLQAGQYLTALALFIAAAVSDGLDGYLAKRFGWTSAARQVPRSAGRQAAAGGWCSSSAPGSS